MELTAGAFPPAFASELYPVVERAQELLGSVTDHIVARDLLRGRKRSPGTARLLAAEETALSRAHAALFEWWTPELADRLQARFRAVTARTPPARVLAGPGIAGAVTLGA